MQGNDTRSVAEIEADNDRAVLAMLLADPGLWSVEEVLRETDCRLDGEDSLNRLHATGLIHRLEDGFVFPSRAATRSAALSG